MWLPWESCENRLWFCGPAVGPETLHFQEAPRGRCWFKDQSLIDKPWSSLHYRTQERLYTDNRMCLCDCRECLHQTVHQTAKKSRTLCTVNTSPVSNQYRFKSWSPIVALQWARQDSIIVPCVWCLALCREKHLSPVSCSCSAALGQHSSLPLRAKRITHVIFDPGWIWLPSNASLGRATGFRCDPPMLCFLAFL